MWICFLSVDTSEPERLKLSNVEIERVPTFKLLGVWQQENLRWNHHINETVKKANKRLHYLRDCCKEQLPPDVGTTVYCTKICPLLEHASPVWGGLPDYLANEIQRVQNRSLDIIGVPRDTLPALSGLKNFPLAHKKVFSFIKKISFSLSMSSSMLFHFLHLKQGFCRLYRQKTVELRCHFACLHGHAWSDVALKISGDMLHASIF